MKKLNLVTLVLLGLCVPASALAQEQVMVLQLDSSQADEVLAGLLTRALDERVAELEGWQAVAPELSIEHARTLSGACEDESSTCIAGALANGDASYVIYGSLRRRDRQRDDGYLVSLYLLSQRSGRIEATVSADVVPEAGVALNTRARGYVDELTRNLSPTLQPTATPAWRPSEHAAERDLARRLSAAAQTRRRTRRIGWGLLAVSGASFGAVMAVSPQRRHQGALAPALFGASALAFGAGLGALLAAVDWHQERGAINVGAGASRAGASVQANVRF